MGFAQNLIAGVATRAAGVVGEQIGAFVAGPRAYMSKFSGTLGIVSGGERAFSRWTAPGLKATAVRGLEAVGITSGKKAVEKIAPFAAKTLLTAGVNTLIWGGGQSNSPAQNTQVTLDGQNMGPQVDKKQETEIKTLEKEVKALQTAVKKIMVDANKEVLTRDGQYQKLEAIKANKE